MPILDVRFYKQPNDMYCHPTSTKMVLNYAISKFKIKQRNYSIRSIARIIGADPAWGTPPGGIELINGALVNSRPSLRFIRQLSGTLREIFEEIDNNRPIIAWINLTYSEVDPTWHAVVIVGYDRDKREVYYLDPQRTKQDPLVKCEIGDFIKNKLGQEGNIIKIEIGGKGQKTLISSSPIPKRETK
jgi:hypothetical protein